MNEWVAPRGPFALHTARDADYTLTASDAFGMVCFSSAAGNSFIVPLPAEIGFRVSNPTTQGTPVAFRVLPGSAPIHLVGAAGVTINPPIGRPDPLFRAGDGARLVPIASDTWICV